MSATAIVSAATAVTSLPRAARIVASPGCGTPETLLTALGAHADVLGSPTLYSGLQLGAYPFLAAVEAGHLDYLTWHPFGPGRASVAAGHSHYVPARASAVPDLLDQWQTTAALIRVSPPDANGNCSLGPSASYVCHAVDRAEVVLAEIDPSIPRTHGDTCVRASRITAFVEADTPMSYFPSAERTTTSDLVAEHIMSILPSEPTIQLGIGAVPESFTAALADSGSRGVRIVGMANDAMISLFERGALSPVTPGSTAVISAAELMGTAALMSFANDNPAVEVRDSRVSHNPRVLAMLPRLVSINSAVEVDLLGQVCSEVAGGRQVSGIGGSMDFVEASFGSLGGLSIVALTSTASAGRHSRIVPRLDSRAITTLPRHTPDVVVSEFGIAWLRGQTERQRAEALIAISHPDHRSTLESANHP